MSGVQGIEDLDKKLQALGDAGSGDALGEAVLAGALVLKGKILISMGSEKHGLTYGSHVASAKGESPAIDTGLLVNSIQAQLVEAAPTSAKAIVFTNAAYAPILEPLEKGTAHKGARPFMRPAADENEEDIKKAVRDVLAQSIEQAVE